MNRPNEITLNSVFPDWLEESNGFFSLLTTAKNVPWKTTISGDILDLEYHGNRSGQKIIAPLLVRMIHDSAISSAMKSKLVDLAFLRYGTNWAKLWETMYFQYNPIENYDLTETETSETYTDTHTPAKMKETASGESAVFGFNSSASVPDAESDATRTTEALANETNQHTPDSTKPRTLSRHGNIGVTTSQQMISSERDLWVWQYFDTVFSNVDDILVLSVYGRVDFILDFDYPKYILPVATPNKLGGVKPVAKISNMTQDIGVDSDGRLFSPPNTFTERREKILYDLYSAANDVYSSTPTYNYTIPINVQKWAELGMVGGKSVVWNQKASNNDSDYSAYNSTKTHNPEDNEFQVTYNTTGTGAGLYSKALPILTIPVGHKCFCSAKLKKSPESSQTLRTRIYLNGATISYYITESYAEYSVIHTTTAQTANQFELDFYCSNFNANDVVYIKDIQVIDLTKMFGAGKEPSTVEAFRAMFPVDYYPYNIGNIINGKCDSVKIFDDESEQIYEYIIPSAIQNLNGYGLSARNAYNELNIGSRKFIQRVSERNYQTGDENDNTLVTDGVKTNYPLVASIEIDVSQYIAEDNMIEVSPGGSLKFQQQNNTMLNLPNSVRFIVKNT